MISLNGSDFYDADSAEAALLLKNASNNLVFYKVIIENKSPINLEKVQISDIFEAQKSEISQLLVRNVRDAIYTDGIFALEELPKRTKATFTYQATLKTKSGLANVSAYNQVEVVDYEIKSRTSYRKKTGQKDRAYVIIPENEIDRSLRKYSNKKMIADGDEVIYTIFFKNEYEYDLRNVVFTDDYDEKRLEIISASAENDGSALKFKRTIIRPGQSVIFRYTAKGINKGEKAVQATNVVKVFTDTVDLSKEEAEVKITIYPFTKKRTLLQTGTGHALLL